MSLVLTAMLVISAICLGLSIVGNALGLLASKEGIKYPAIGFVANLVILTTLLVLANGYSAG